MSGWLAITTIASTLVRSVGGLEWQNEVNVSMCNWAQFRASVIRDTIYLDGGELWWQAGLSDGSYASPQNDGGIDGAVYTLNLGQPFNQSTNVTGLFKTLPRTGVSASNNIAPNYVDGAMFANDDEWITFGGLVDATNSSSAPAENAVLGYEAYQYGPARQSWSSGFITKDLPTNITRYITNGASTSAPSENMGYYFSGMRATDWGPIFNEGGSADTLANTLISVNMSVMRQETWDNDTLPTSVPARANAEIAWIPAGKNGVLVAIGGVINPVSLTAAQALNTSQVNASTQTSPTFMDTVSLYDIANKKWYQQNTTGDIPPQLTLFCSVVASARDQSSFNIYIYGGYDGINQSSIPSDDVYILSVPQMIWTHAYTGQSNHGRSGHKCFMVYPDQMMILGGIYAGNPVICLQGGIAEVFNLNNLRFQDSYDPRVWGEYKVPDAVTAKIGGNGNGSATIQSPPTISDVFATAYTKTITTYYPYALQPRNSTNTSSPSPGPTTITVTGGGGLPSWVGPVLGVVLGLVVVAAAIILFLIWRRRKSRRSTRASETQASTNGIRGFVLRWLYGTAAQDAKSQADLGLTDIDGATVVSSKSHDRHVSEAGSVAVHEMEGIGTPVFEMGSNNQAPHWNETQWSQPERSPPLVSPNIDEMMFSSHSQARPIHRNVRHTSSFSTGYRSDESSISEIGSSDPGRPLPKRQEPDNSASDVASLPASQEAGNVETSNREHTSTAVARMSGRITTVPEDEEHNAEDAVSPSGEINDRRQLPHDSTQLE